MPALPDTAYLYVVVRKDLPGGHLAVQACHAAIASMMSFFPKSLHHPHLVLCEVAGEQALAELFESLKAEGVPCCAYREPDMGSTITALATAQLKGKERHPLRKLKLLR